MFRVGCFNFIELTYIYVSFEETDFTLSLKSKIKHFTSKLIAVFLGIVIE